MKIISFAWTMPALKAKRKKVTRRNWNDKYARQFKAGEKVLAYDKNPRMGGKQIGIILLTQDPYQESTEYMPDSDYEAEGLAYLEEQGLLIRGMSPLTFWKAWKAAKETLWVIRFELICE